MKSGKILVVILFVSMLFLSLYIYSETARESDILSICMETNEGFEHTRIWKCEDEAYYVFLPGYVQLESVYLVANNNAKVSIEHKRIEERVSCENFKLNTTYDMEYSMLGRKYSGKIIFVQSNNVSTMFIDTESGSMDYIHAQKRNTEKGNIRLYRDNGAVEYLGTLNSMAGRGNSTWDDHEKKAYNIEFAEDVNLLDMGDAKDWVLLANAKDSSNMKNKIVYDFAAMVGLAYSPDSQWVDLYLNGEYAGLYLMCEQNEVHEQRVAIEGENSFLVSREGKGRMVSQNLPHITTDAGQTLRIRYPDSLTENQKAEMRAVWQSIENAILDEGSIDSVTGKSWLDLIDLDSWVKKHLIEEIFGSLDANFNSQFFYSDGNIEKVRVFAGPVWDYDLSMGGLWQTDGIDFLWANRLHVTDEHDAPWFHELYKKDEFYGAMVEIFQGEFLPLLYELRDEGIQAYASFIEDASKMNSIRWNLDDAVDVANTIKVFLCRRIDFLEDLWINNQEYHIVEAQSSGGFYAYFAVADGECMPSLPRIENSDTRKFDGWYYEDGTPVDYKIPIKEDTRIVAHWRGMNVYLIMYAQYFVPIGILALIFVMIFAFEIRQMVRGKICE